MRCSGFIIDDSAKSRNQSPILQAWELLKMIIENWYHKPGRHCASTAIRDAMRFHGIDWNEALCFGLGRGLGVFYMRAPGFSPSRLLHTRCADLEKHFFESLGLDFAWNTAGDDRESLVLAKSHIDSGIPVLLQTDIFFIPYYNSKTHFNRHAVLMWGYDDEAEIGYLSDTQFEGLKEAPLDSLAKARNSKHPPGPVKYDFFPMTKLRFEKSIESSMIEATKTQAFELMGPASDYPIKLGLKALEELARDLPSWAEAEDWQWSARFSYQTIEKRGTGGSAFRKMYAEFLDQVENISPKIKKLDLSAKMRRIANKWSELALLFKEISEMNKPAKLDEAAAIVNTIHDLEYEYCKAALSAE